MGTIRPTSATIASLYITFLAFILLCIYNFTPVTQRFFVENISYGIAFIILSICGLVSGITAGDVEDPLLRGFLLCLASMWGALGVYNVTIDIPNPNIWSSVPSEALFPGYGAFFFISLIFAFGCLLHQSIFTAVLAFGLFLSTIFEIASLWRPVRMGTGAYYILLGAMAIYMACKMFVDKLRGKDFERGKHRNITDSDISNDYTIVGYSMDVVIFAVFASHVTGATTEANKAYIWVATAGCFQTVCGVVAIRRSDPYCGCYFTLYGVFWCAVAYNLALSHFSGTNDLPLLAVFIFFIVIFFLTSLVSLVQELFQSLQNLLLSIFCIAICVDGVRGRFLGGMGWVCFVFSLYGLAAHMSRIKPTPYKLPLGRRLFERAQIKQILTSRLSCCTKFLYGRQTEQRKDDVLFSTDFSDMGYSKFIDLDAIGFAANAVSALSVLWIPAGFNLLTIPWVTIVGGAAQFTVGCIGFARGLTFESCSFMVFSTMWLILGTARGLCMLAADNSIANCIGSIVYMIVTLPLIGLSLVISKAWFLITFLFELIALAFLLHTLAVPSYDAYEIIVVLLFTIVCLYCFLATAFKSIWGRELLPMGSPIIQVSYLHSQGHRAFWAHARRLSGVEAIAEIMNNGGIVGIPSDTVYVLAAAVKFPKSVERAYLTKKLAEDRPMSMWISNMNQLAAGREQFGEMLWAFMDALWPSSISCVVNKGPWLDSLGIGYAAKYVGRPDSIAVRMPDNTVTSFLIDHTGPISTTSANPTGEADTTHHLQVLAKLGLKNCDGILCDGPSFANSASTVVDCRKIDEGKLGFFRIGLEPKSKIEEIFERIQAQFRDMMTSHRPSTHSVSETLDSGVYVREPDPIPLTLEEFEGHVNAAFDDDDDQTSDEINQLKRNVASTLTESGNILEDIQGPNTKDQKAERAPEDIKTPYKEHYVFDSLEQLIHNTKSKEPEIAKLISSLQDLELSSNRQSNQLGVMEDMDGDYEKMSFGNLQMAIASAGNEPNSNGNSSDKVSSIDNIGDNEPLTSMKSRKRRVLQDQINKYVLNRGKDMGLVQRNPALSVNKESYEPNDSEDLKYTFRTILEINVNQYHQVNVDQYHQVNVDQYHQKLRPGNPFLQQHGNQDVEMKTSETPLLEDLTSVSKKKLIPPAELLVEDNDVLSTIEKNEENFRKSQIDKFSQNQGQGDRVFNVSEDNGRNYSLIFVNKDGKLVPDQLDLPPNLERIESFTQRTQL